MCLACDKVFDRVQRLEAHQKNPMLNECDLCDKKFCSDADHNHHQIVDHFVNPRKCKTCCKVFKVFSDLEKHRKDASPRECDLCDKTFCTNNDYKNHQIVEHRGRQVPALEYKSILKQVIYPSTGLENEDGYKEMAAKHDNVIKDNVVDRKECIHDGKHTDNSVIYVHVQGRK